MENGREVPSSAGHDRTTDRSRNVSSLPTRSDRPQEAAKASADITRLTAARVTIGCFGAQAMEHSDEMRVGDSVDPNSATHAGQAHY